ncbi:MAG TPA: sigma factor [Anaerolineales bacterium]|jgi:RNA polymerase sigma-70 factor (ECF subfamily)|nr:sigma factor [Anaerolineales bacterium]
MALGSTELPYRQRSDDLLAACVVQGDVRALETLYDRHAAMVLGIALKITDDQDLAEAVLQETFWQVWQRADAYPSGDRVFTAWLFRMARSLAIDACQQ